MAENDFIDWLKRQARQDDRLVVPIGDDLAAMKWIADDLLLVGVDQVLDGVHFDSAVHSPRAIGRKAMNRNLSDCAAMACQPAAAVCTIALHQGSGDAYARELLLGMQEAGAAFNCPIIGGDTGSWPGKLAVTVTILGRSDGVPPITRGGAKAGDQLYVSGPLGGSIHGRHMTFEPRIKLARYLAKNFKIHALMDLSDGLGVDLRRLCDASGVGVHLLMDHVPVHGDVEKTGDAYSRTVHAMADGEDYELLIASPDELPEPCIKIGWLQKQLGLEMVVGEAEVQMNWPELGGWQHSL